MLTFKGICDASAGVALDADHIIVGDDEQPWLSIYRLGGGDSDEQDHAAAPRGVDRRCGTRGRHRRRHHLCRPIVWISSNGRNTDGKVKPDRFQLFASHRLERHTSWTEDFSPSFARLPKAIRATDGDDYKPLRKAVGDLERRRSDLAPKEHGFNVEGLTVSEDGQDPVGRGAQSASARQGDPVPDRQRRRRCWTARRKAKLGAIISLDLGDRGIRDIAWSPAHHAYLIAAGQTKDDDPARASRCSSGMAAEARTRSPRSEAFSTTIRSSIPKR